MKPENIEVKVLDINGNELPSTMRNGKVRKLLKEKKAKVANKDPFTIQLLYEVTENDEEDCEIDEELSNWMSEYANNLLDKTIDFTNIVKELVPFHSYWETDKNKDSAIVKLKALLLKYYDDFYNTYREWEKESGKYYNAFLVLRSISLCAQHEKDHNQGSWHYAFPTFITEFVQFTLYEAPYGQEHYDRTMKYLHDAIYIIEYEEEAAFSKFFGEDYKTLLLLLKQLEVDISKCYQYYLELLRVYEPLNIIVTDRDIVPKFTNYKSIRIVCEDFENIITMLEQYEFNGEFGEKEFYRRLFYQSNIFVDFASYCKDTSFRIMLVGLGMDILFYRFNTDTKFTNAHYKDDEIVFSFIPRDPLIFNIKDSMTADEMYKANKRIIPNKQIMCEDPHNYCSRHGKHFFDGTPKQLTEDDVFEADYTIHQVEILFDVNSIEEETWYSDSTKVSYDLDRFKNEVKPLVEANFSDTKFIELKTRLFYANELYDFCLNNINNVALHYWIANNKLLSFDSATKTFYNRFYKKSNYINEYDKYNYEVLIDVYFYDDVNKKLVKIKDYKNYEIHCSSQLSKVLSVDETIENLKYFKNAIDNKTSLESTLITLTGYYFDISHEKALTEQELKTIKELYDFIKINGPEYNIYITMS